MAVGRNMIHTHSNTVLLQYTVKHRTPDQIRTGNFVIFPNLKWFGNKLVQNFVGRNKLVRKILVSEFSWSERTNSGMVKQQALWTNLGSSICNFLLIAMCDLDETFRECLSDFPSGIAITKQNKICMIHFKHNRIFYREIWRTSSESTQLRVAD